MTDKPFKRRLAALVSADVVGYSRLMAGDEIATMRAMETCRVTVTAVIESCSGRLVDFVGDNLLAEFSNTMDAVNCAIGIQAAMRSVNASLPNHRHILFRIGVHMGDVLADGDRLYGDGVNIAARLEALADTGGICVSDMVYRQVSNKKACDFIDLGERRLKNIPQTVHVYQIVGSPHDRSAAGPVVDRFLSSPPLPRPARPSLAVMPFVNLSADPDQTYLADGLTIDLMTALLRLPGLFVISDATMINFKSALSSVKEIGHVLGVKHVLEGGVRRSGDRVRISARLIETAKGAQIWAERYDSQLTDIFDVQDEITREIVSALDVELVSGTNARMVYQVFKNPKALESYFKGIGAIISTKATDIAMAREMFEETVRLEPDTCVGYALAGWAHIWEAFWGLVPDEDRSIKKARMYAQQAMHRKDTTGLAELVIAMAHLLENEPEAAFDASTRALLARPNCDFSYATKASIFNYLGHYDEAIELARMAMRLSPVYPSFYASILAASYVGSQKYDEAIAASEISLESNPEDLDALVAIAQSHAAMGRLMEAKRWGQAILNVNRNFSITAFFAKHPYTDLELKARIVQGLTQCGLS